LEKPATLIPTSVQDGTNRRCQFGIHRVIALAGFGQDAKCSIGWIGWIGWIGTFYQKGANPNFSHSHWPEGDQAVACAAPTGS
jgi:hypothetical protein